MLLHGAEACAPDCHPPDGTLSAPTVVCWISSTSSPAKHECGLIHDRSITDPVAPLCLLARSHGQQWRFKNPKSYCTTPPNYRSQGSERTSKQASLLSFALAPSTRVNGRGLGMSPSIEIEGSKRDTLCELVQNSSPTYLMAPNSGGRAHWLCARQEITTLAAHPSVLVEGLIAPAATEEQ